MNNKRKDHKKIIKTNKMSKKIIIKLINFNNLILMIQIKTKIIKKNKKLCRLLRMMIFFNIKDCRNWNSMINRRKKRITKMRNIILY